MKILHILPPTNIGPIDKNLHTTGIVYSVWLLDKFLTEKGHESYIAWSKNSKVCGHLIPIIDDLIIKKVHRPQPKIFQDYYKKISKLIDDNSFDVVHYHMARPLFHKRYQPSVFTLRLPIDFIINSFGKVDERFIGMIVPYLVFTVALTEQQAGAYRKRNYYVDGVINNAIDINEFSISKQKRKHLLIMGRIQAEKGQDIAISVAKKCGIPLVIAGDIWDERYFDEKIKPYVDGKFVKYVGYASFNVKKKLYQSSLALLVPIRRDEAFGMTVIEAMACGTPVVAFNRGSMPEIIINSKNGFMVEDEVEMVRAVGKCSQIQNNFCRDYVKNNFDIEKIGMEYEYIYKRLISQKKLHSLIYPITKSKKFYDEESVIKNISSYLRLAIFD